MHSFGNIPDRLSNDFRVLTLDFYGFGNTPSPNHPLALIDYVNGVKDLIDYYSLTDVVLLGHSFGGRVAMLFANTYSDCVATLILIDSAGVKPRRGLKYYTKLITHKILKKCHLNGLKGSADYSTLSDVDKRTFINIVNQDLTPILKSISQPTLLIWGGRDKDTPLYMAKKLNKHIKNSDLVVFSRAGHFAYLDELNATTAVIRYFLMQC